MPKDYKNLILAISVNGIEDMNNLQAEGTAFRNFFGSKGIA
jgi:hypothetical protein